MLKFKLSIVFKLKFSHLMKIKLLLLGIAYIYFLNNLSSQNQQTVPDTQTQQIAPEEPAPVFPGGVVGAEVWYKTTAIDLQSGEYTDFSGNAVSIEDCNPPEEALFNFNPSLKSDKICLYYTAPLEEATAHNVFMVSEPKDWVEPYRQVSTIFDANVIPFPNTFQNSLSRNAYFLETKQGYASQVYAPFSEHQNTHVHFYSWSNYDQDKKFKSYGQNGETLYNIGRPLPANNLPVEELEDGLWFDGLLPEYISYNRSLTDNERNRVESYLALKYGITLGQHRHYKNSKNKIFWDKENNNLFGNNVFGIGRDDISSLYQLQCESAHKRDYLVAATYQIAETNNEVKSAFSIENNNFLVFGDTGPKGLAEKNDLNLRLLNKTWLAQATGDSIRSNLPIYFKLFLNEEFQPFFEDLNEGKLKMWMLHDKYTDNSYVSDFDNGNIGYYKATNIEFLPDGKVYAHWKNEAMFDEDESFFDQFTFAIGPEIIVQIRYDQRQCAEKCFKVDIVIEGGEPEYHVVLLDETGQETEVQFSHVNEDHEFIYNATVCGDQTYSVIVKDENGAEVNYDFFVEGNDYTLELGPNQYLTGQQTEVFLNAGQGIDDPNATYQWFFDGEQIYHNESTLITDEPGLYCVTVTTSDMICQLEDCIKVLTKLNGVIKGISECIEDESYISIQITDGAPPFMVNVTGNGQNFSQSFSGYSHEIPNLAPGSYQVIIEDAVGAVLQEMIVINNSPMVNGEFTIGVEHTLTALQPQVLLDGTSPFNTNVNAIYAWYWNGELLAETSSELNVSLPGTYTMNVNLPESECDGEAIIDVLLDFDANIESSIDDCDPNFNTLSVFFHFGIPPYDITLDGDNGVIYSYEGFTGDFTVSDIAFGDYEVTIEDSFGNSIEEVVNFPGTDIQLNLLEQQLSYCNQCDCVVYENVCDTDITAVGFINTNCIPTFFIDASQLIDPNQQVTYSWSVNGETVDYNDSIMNFEVCQGENQYYGSGTGQLCGLVVVSVTVTDIVTGCLFSETIGIYKNYCPVINENGEPDPLAGKDYKTKLYPNPSKQGGTFYYEISSEENFEGTIGLYDMNGSLLRQQQISGENNYTLPFSLITSGVYFITTQINGKLITDRIIIE